MKNLVFVFFAMVLLVFSGCRIGDDPTTPVGNGGGGSGVYKLTFTTPDAVVLSGSTAYVTAVLTKDSTNVKDAEIEFLFLGVSEYAKLEPAKNLTSEKGEAYSVFSADLPDGIENRSYSIIAKHSSGAADTAKVTVTSEPTEIRALMKLTATPARINADGTSNSVVTAILTDTNGISYAGQKINFKTTSGRIILTQPSTNDNGEAKISLISVPRNVTALVQAQLDSDPTITANCEVEFIGVSLKLSKDKESIIPDGKDTVTITAKLLDAGQNPIVKETVRFQTLDTTFKIISKDSVTNTAGEAKAKLVGKGIDKSFEKLVAAAAGANDTITVNYSSKFIKVDTSGFSNNYTVSNEGTQNLTKLKITYFESDKTTPISGAEFTVSVNRGGILTGTNVSSFVTLKPSSTSFELTLVNPTIAGNMEVKVIANKDGDTTSRTEIVYIKSGKLYSLTVKATPEVISIGGEAAKVTAVAKDSSGNFCAGEMIYFKQIKGPGGAGQLASASATTNEFGEATVDFVSGNNESDQKGVQIIATAAALGSDGNPIPSKDTAVITIASTVAKVNLTENISKIIKGTATYSKELEVLVQDINGNPVPDGMPVVFSARVIGWTIWQRDANVTSDGKTYSVGNISRILRFDDYNFNYIRDKEEGSATGYPLARGEQIAMFAQDTSFRPDKKFWDINGNGVRDYMTSDGTIKNLGYYSPEPWWYESELVAKAHSPIADIKGLTQGIYPPTGEIVYFLDYNGNGILDISEPLMTATGGIDISSITDAALSSYYNNSPDGGRYKDTDWNNNGKPEPAEKENAVVITRTLTTIGGKVSNMLTYAQSDAWRLCVEVWAEVKGIKSNSIKYEPLPIVEEDVKYFNPFQGKDNLW